MGKRWIVVLALVAAIASAGEPSLLDRLGVKRGICVVLYDSSCRTAISLARNSELTVYTQLAGDPDPARKVVDAAGLLNTRVFIVEGGQLRIRLADNVADGVVVGRGDMPPFFLAEVLRVLRPGGKVIAGSKELTKPWPKGVDDWSHHYHGPDNNAQSQDKVARAPYLTQFVAEPRYGPAPQACVAAGGRVFMAFGNVAWHEREEPWLDTLIALNGFNGTTLWTRKLPSGFMVDRSMMIATPDALYVADDQSCKLLDPETGVVKDEIVVSKDVAGGSFWKWMALDDGVLYALVGQAEKPDPVAKWRRRAHGWPWGGISDGYNKGPYRWGFASTLLAIDPKTKKVLWRHAEPVPIDSRGICMKGGRVYCCAFGKYIASLDAKNGQEVWRRTAEKDPDVFKAIGQYRPGHGYRTGWKSTIYLRCSDRALYFSGPQVYHLTAVSADDGHHLWTYPSDLNCHVVLQGDAVYAVGAQGTKDNTKKLDPMTGKLLATYGIVRRACTRSTGSVDSIFFRSHGDGTERIDLATGKTQWFPAMRPSCFTGVIVAHGHLYFVPWVCDCNLQMFGTFCLSPAGGFGFDQPARERDRLETGEAKVTGLDAAPADWPTYRANNLRSATTEAAVPEQVGLLWQAKPKAAFEATAPVAAGGLALVSGSDGIVRAFDAASGEARWTAYTGGAVRYPPAIAGGRAFVGSGDGYAYAFDAATGKLLWRFRAAPTEHRIPFYGALLSRWPVATGVLVADGVAYCGAGIHTFDGTHVFALDAATGKIRWQNNTCGGVGPALGRGAAAQGDLLLHEGKLYMAGGNAASPVAFDLASGKVASRGQRGRRGRELRYSQWKDRRGQTHRGVIAVGQPLYSTPETPVFSGECKWQPWAATAKNAVLSCQQRDGAWHVVATKPGTQEELWAHRLPAEPLRWGIAVDAAGRIVVTLRSGQVVCLGAKG